MRVLIATVTAGAGHLAAAAALAVQDICFAGDFIAGAQRDLEAAYKKELLERYRPDIARLEGLIGRDLSHWLKDK